MTRMRRPGAPLQHQKLHSRTHSVKVMDLMLMDLTFERLCSAFSTININGTRAVFRMDISLLADE